MPGGRPADHPASHWGKVAHAGAHQVEHTQEEHAPLEELGPPVGMVGTLVFQVSGIKNI